MLLLQQICQINKFIWHIFAYIIQFFAEYHYFHITSHYFCNKKTGKVILPVFLRVLFCCLMQQFLISLLLIFTLYKEVFLSSVRSLIM